MSKLIRAYLRGVQNLVAGLFPNDEMPNLTMALGVLLRNLTSRNCNLLGYCPNAKAVLIRGKLFSSSMFEIVNVKARSQ
jgi:hypothetical protein